jgi:endogenous inhibitor of DNA gyrase (YacG/DUF329 family)
MHIATNENRRYSYETPGRLTTMPECPECGAAFVQKTTGGRPRRFCTDECRKRWNADNGILTNEVAAFRVMAEEAQDNAQRLAAHGYSTAPGWARSADRYRREADELEKRLEERKHG